MIVNHPLILASKSPRRQQLLADLGLEFSIKVKDTDEIYPDDLAKEKVPEYLAKLKAEAFLGELNDEILITSDTIVLLENEILGKPKDREDAFLMLKKLSGKMHLVITGVCLLSTAKEACFSDVTKVYFKPISDEEIRYYLDRFKPYDKAGSYGIQEWIGMTAIEKIEGSYFNVMGLPVHRVYEELQKF